MSLQRLPALLAVAPDFAHALEYATTDADFSVGEAARSSLLAGLLGQRVAHDSRSAVALAIAATSREADALRSELQSLLPRATVVEFPAWETLPHERLSPSAETVGRRIDVLNRLAEHVDSTAKAPFVIVASVRAALQPIVGDLNQLTPVVLRAGAAEIALTQLAARLSDFAYSRVDMVTRRGEFAVRGGILDVFPPSAEHAMRVEFFGDEVEEIREFAVADQRTIQDAHSTAFSELKLYPARELLLTPTVRQRAEQLKQELPQLSDMLERLSAGIPVEGMESLTPVLRDDLRSLVEFLPDAAAVVVLSPERVATRAMQLAETNREFLEAAWNAATAGGVAPVELGRQGFLTLSELHEAAGSRTWWTTSSFVQDEDELTDDVIVRASTLPTFAGQADQAIEFVRSRLAQQWQVVITAQGTGLVERARDVLLEHGLAARMVEQLPDQLETGIAYVVHATQWRGFESDVAKLLVMAEAEFFGRTVSYQASQPTKLASKRKNVVDPLKLVNGDYVVHEVHGIGRFIELTQRMIPSGMGRNATKIPREYLVLEYASSKRGMPADKLFVPTDQLDQLSRYVGGEAPALSKMGGSDWATAKGKARRAVRDIAIELVKLYSARMAAKGYAFSPDSPWQHELEEAFPFVETPDQLTTIDEVKRDMESQVPMDRLVSGDVGFGKTEIAVRAAFKAIQDNKQVAVLVPTTLLVKQHVETFQNRFAGFPVQLRALSRFQSAKEVKETLAGLADGSIDMVIGTHRILTEGIAYKDLGLVIIDEEQRFGVEHKDALKKLKTNVDILAMSATPIPRTLEMAVTGIREMSTLATAPEDRHPILTFVGPRSNRQIAAAIRREMLREGQVFFVHNRVQSIGRVAAELAELIPEARIAVAHGKLSETALEQVVVDFWERKFDVLVTTTIIETGLDIANANTIIIDRADKYGLSQLHQLRGRVGRSRERAYAYFLYDEDHTLSETAFERLETIASHNDLGAGMQVALKDLELRGAGNLLGGEQSGHIAGVGFDLYLRMIGEAVNVFKGEEITESTELTIELPVVAHIPEDFVESERLRLEAYQKFSAASHVAAEPTAIDLVLDELTDRYGEIPVEVLNLAAVSRLRRKAAKLGLSKILAAGPMLRIEPVELPDSRVMRMQRMYPGSKLTQASKTLTIPLPVVNGQTPRDQQALDWVGDIFENLLQPVAPVTPSPSE